MNIYMMIKQVDEDEKALETIFREDGSTHKQWFLTEDGLYEVLMQSRKQNTSIFYQKKDTQTLCTPYRKTSSFNEPAISKVVGAILTGTFL